MDTRDALIKLTRFSTSLQNGIQVEVVHFDKMWANGIITIEDEEYFIYLLRKTN